MYPPQQTCSPFLLGLCVYLSHTAHLLEGNTSRSIHKNLSMYRADVVCEIFRGCRALFERYRNVVDVSVLSFFVNKLYLFALFVDTAVSALALRIHAVSVKGSPCKTLLSSFLVSASFAYRARYYIATPRPGMDTEPWRRAETTPKRTKKRTRRYGDLSGS